MLQDDDLLSFAAVVEQTKWCRETVRKVFPFRRIGGRLFILRSEVERTLREGGQHVRTA